MPHWNVQRVAHAIELGAVIAYPTDTIWGLGCHPRHSGAIDRLLAAKKRSLHKGLILLSADIEYCRPFIDPEAISDNYSLLASPYDRPRTWIIKASTDCPNWLTGKNSGIAFRITSKPLVQELTERLGTPIVSTSANLSGRRHARNRLIVQRHFGTRVDFVLNDTAQPAGLNSLAQASEIIDLQSGKTVRP